MDVGGSSPSGPTTRGFAPLACTFEPIDGRNHPNLFAAVKTLALGVAPGFVEGGGPHRDEFTKAVETAGELDKARKYGMSDPSLGAARVEYRVPAQIRP